MTRMLSVSAVPVALGALGAMLQDRGLSDGFVLLAVVCVVSAAGVIRRRDLLQRPAPPAHDQPELQQAELKSESTKVKGTAAG